MELTFGYNNKCHIGKASIVKRSKSLVFIIRWGWNMLDQQQACCSWCTEWSRDISAEIESYSSSRRKSESDNGYCGDDWTSTPLDSRNIMKDSAHGHCERVNPCWFKYFNCLSQFFVDKEKHAFCFEAFVVLTEIEIDHKETLDNNNYDLK
jgi:hypothetical protein